MKVEAAPYERRVISLSTAATPGAGLGRVHEVASTLTLTDALAAAGVST